MGKRNRGCRFISLEVLQQGLRTVQSDGIWVCHHVPLLLMTLVAYRGGDWDTGRGADRLPERMTPAGNYV